MNFNNSNNLVVEEIHDNGQFAEKGVQKNWKIIRVGNKAVTESNHNIIRDFIMNENRAKNVDIEFQIPIFKVILQIFLFIIFPYFCN